MTETHWLIEQFTLGNIVTIISLAMSIGWQAHRLTVFERDLRTQEARLTENARNQKEQLAEMMRLVEATYERRDVMAVTLQGVYTQLHGMHQTLERLVQRLEPPRSEQR